jgi:photosystem II stability/assembly factor-like uncharacterized protein
VKATEALNGLLKMEKAEHSSAGAILLTIFVVLIGWYFLVHYLTGEESLNVREKALTAHDDLLAIEGHRSGNKVAVGKFGLILLTTDGGKTWQRRPSGTTKALSAISFADHQHGFIVGSGGTLLATNDGGATWRAQNSETKDQLLGVYALTPTRVFAVGAFGTLLSTSDGGRSWIKHELKWNKLIEQIVKNTGYVEPNLNAVYFSSSEMGWVVGEFGVVLHTHDGGKTWASQRYGSDLPQLYGIQFRDDRQGWAVGQAGQLIQTNDAGRRWNLMELGTTRDLYGISVEGERGIVVGDGITLGSRDAGSTWIARKSHREDQWLSGVTLKSSEAIAVGRAGTAQLLSLDETISERTREMR